MNSFLFVVFVVATNFLSASCESSGADLSANKYQKEVSVKIPIKFPEKKATLVRNLLTPEQLYNTVKSSTDTAFVIDLGSIKKLSDNSTVNPTDIYGTCYIGPYSFEPEKNLYHYSRLRKTVYLSGENPTRVDMRSFIIGSYNSNNWTDSGELLFRFILMQKKPDKDRNLGTYEIRVSFKMEKPNKFKKVQSLKEGPYIGLVLKDSCTVSFTSWAESNAKILINNGKYFTDNKKSKRHEIILSGLKPATTYSYRIILDNDTLPQKNKFTSAPPIGFTKITFATAGDSREGVGGGLENFMGTNKLALQNLFNIAYQKNAEFVIFGGDLINGHTTVKADFESQLYAWKHSISGFLSERPVYSAMGNHEALLRVFDDKTYYGLRMDRWPYKTQSAEAVFADKMINPKNAPLVLDSKMPSYSENVYSFSYGCVRFICFNNNYWYALYPEKNGGAPEGYMFEDQLKWIKKELKKAERDKNILYTVLYAQEPVFPCGPHQRDAMWYSGNNNIRALKYDGNKLIPEKKGIIEVRNEFAQMVGSCKKVATVITSDEHNYTKVLINKHVPVGIPKKDDKNKNNILEKTEKLSSLNLKYGTWYIITGGTGAPYYSDMSSPWGDYWKSKKNSEQFYYNSAQENICVFTTSKNKFSLTVYNKYGEVIDRIDNLMDKKGM